MRHSRWFVASLALFSTVLIGLFVVKTLRWPLVGDAPLIHYAVFLLEHGFAPYTEIVDPNLPGTYLIVFTILKTLGTGALAWRIFDYLLLLVVGGNLICLSPSGSRVAGYLAATMFALLHGRDGLIDTGQRDLMLVALVLCSFSALCAVLRGPAPSLARQLLLLAAAGLVLGLAVLVKPTALLLPVPLWLVIRAYPAIRFRSRISALYFASGLLLPLAMCAIYLHREGALRAFLLVQSQLVPYHARLFGLPWARMVATTLSSVLLGPVLAWLPVCWVQKRWRSYEGSLLAIGLFFGLASYIVQRRDYPYHRYPSEVFLLLWMMLDLYQASMATEHPGRRYYAAALLTYLVLVVGGTSVHRALSLEWRNVEFNQMVASDLDQLGGARLDGKVQCLDMASGCLNVLYNLRLRQSTGFLYDCYLYPERRDNTAEAADAFRVPERLDPEEARYRAGFWRALTEAKPEVLIVTSDECSAAVDYHFSKLHRWGELDSLLTDSYHLYAQRIPPSPVRWTRDPSRPVGYRIYVSNGSPGRGLAGSPDLNASTLDRR